MQKAHKKLKKESKKKISKLKQDLAKTKIEFKQAFDMLENNQFFHLREDF